MAEFASKGVAGSGLGLGIAGTALGVLNGGLGNILGGNFNNTCPSNQFINRYELEMENKYLNEEVEIERFHPNFETGLTAEQIELRKSQGLVNKVSSGSNKTILSIFIKNAFALFV